ncbi:Meiotic nuclear division protein 1 [Araneus ventricosus]|uniref:Meiotic nuclear division protein 1 homolog n=1 Tax=Araneus ventricosus TaxID=182803 RepID=A0A4Y2QB06_ARAVE|nr:Meiotic nuclear division protein 1 [Araneus ventricosus]GBN59221.1 Meiotic nuclear division protein 1 [Araneus ventricosus]GBN60759.1 Meiotic nuclear division protein 1 [Araneus ventricosus]GBN60830.1 Meiotic nuclear division protein 1 [Araneus ventricosus]
MSKKKGLSVEEKRNRMLEIFYEKKDVYQLKDLEKICPKEKGIVAQSVKDVLQSLVDDGLVDSEKVGTSIYFWAFPSKAFNNRKRKINDLNTKLDEARKKIKRLDTQLAEAKCGREDSVARDGVLTELNKCRKEVIDVKEKIEKYKDCDPQVLEEVKKQIEISKEAANRWTDNIFAIKSWCKNKFFIEESVLNKQFGIPEELDYIE